MKKNIKLIVLCSSVIFAILALIMLALPGVAKPDKGTYTLVDLGGLVFGRGTAKTVFLDAEPTQTFTGGLSIFGLIGFILLILAMVAVVVKVVLKKKYIEFIAAALFVLAGISMFLLLSKGTDITFTLSPELPFKHTYTFKAVFDGLSIGVGTILFSIFSILAGACACASHFVKNSK